MAVPTPVIGGKYEILLDGNVVDVATIIKFPDKYTLWVQEEQSNEKRLLNRYLFEVGLEDGTIRAVT